MAVTFEIVGDIVKFKGLSSDTKPTTYQAPGGEDAVPIDSTFDETDGSKNKSRFNGNSWVQISTGGAGHVKADSIVTTAGGQSNKITVSSSSAQSVAINSNRMTFYSTVDGFIRFGSNPTALSNGTDDFIPSGNKLRVSGLVSGEKFAFITTGGGGTLYYTPGG